MTDYFSRSFDPRVGTPPGTPESGSGAAHYALEFVFVVLLLAFASQDDNGDEHHGQNTRHQLHCSLRHDLAPERPNRKYKTNPIPDASTRNGRRTVAGKHPGPARKHLKLNEVSHRPTASRSRHRRRPFRVL